ncbi:anti-sigma factor antagonist [Paenibacillus darwinianus]|uniref:Anti-sigma factor antagonist n=1 Tax=Paenibacillus darwinianus TaxID=1380763 RepID=A0A9W5S2Q9_9BACL|nr:STAS domain-containing protein [Paenibacillus darwinianus]EXX89490.1 anti-sigma factor antagonist [Paenibacillus darwinianus]EXX91179.1 anti-sigma factor antagonist [Paenibacillus darwinianus]EXX92527.1 anti-sigma factor antagonist [Paenibacillus darwinianus]
MFRYKIVDEETRTVVFLQGDMDIDVTETIEEEVMPALTYRKEVHLDFAEVQFVDSSGIGLLISLVQHLTEQGIKTRIIHLNAEVKQVFELLQLPDILGHDVMSDFEGGAS